MDSKRYYENLDDQWDDDSEEAWYFHLKQAAARQADATAAEPHPDELRQHSALLRLAVARKLGIPPEDVSIAGWTLRLDGSAVYRGANPPRAE